jgi:hypothetical protein
MRRDEYATGIRPIHFSGLVIAFRVVLG